MDDELESLKKVDLVELAKVYGYEIDSRRSTRNAVAMRSGYGSGGHKIVVGFEDGRHVFYTVDGPGESGSVLDFVQNRLRQSGQSATLGHVRRVLRRYTSFSCRPDSPDSNRPSGPSGLKTGREDERGNIADTIELTTSTTSHPYLMHRGIPPKVQGCNRFSGCIRKDWRGNALFPHCDRHGWIGGEVYNLRFKGQVQGGRKGLWLSNRSRTDTQIVIAESAVDCLSYHIVHSGHDQWYVSFGGGISPYQRDLIEGLLVQAKKQCRCVIIAVDNDSEGRKHRDIISSLAPDGLDIRTDMPQVKDWNDALILGQRLE